MQKFWWSAETQADVGAAFARTIKPISAELNHLLADISFGGKAEQWAFIAIILPEENADYGEVVKKSSQGKVLEFRLKILHGEFLAATDADRGRLVLKTLLRSVELMAGLGVSTETQNALRSVLFRAERICCPT